MKKIISLMIIFCIVMLLCSCADTPKSPERLPAPQNIKASDRSLTWDNVASSKGYIVKINGVEQNADGNTCYLYDLTDYEIQVKALGDGVNYLDSEFSELFNYAPPAIKLVTPDTKMEGGYVIWETIPNAVKYEITVINPDNSELDYETENISFLYLKEEGGLYTIKVKAVSDSKFYEDSEFGICSYYIDETPPVILSN
jgi:hypothetical protein